MQHLTKNPISKQNPLNSKKAYKSNNYRHVARMLQKIKKCNTATIFDKNAIEYCIQNQRRTEKRKDGDRWRFSELS